MASSHKITIKVLEESLRDLKSWKSFGLGLPGISQEDIDSILGEDHDDTADQKRALYEKWLQSHSNPNWEDVVLALEQIEETEIAENCKKLFMGYNSTQTNEIDENIIEMESTSEIKDLYSDFTFLFKRVQTSLTSLIKRKRVSFLKVISVIKREIVLKEEELDNIDAAPELFKIISQYINFLNFDKFQAVSESFLLFNDRSDMKNYAQKLKHLKMSAKMLEFKNVDFTFSTLSQAFFTIKIKLHSTFLELSIDSVETIVDRAYGKLSQHFQWNSVEITPLSITFVAPCELKQSLLDQSKRQVQFLRLTGVYSLQIDDVVVLNEEEDPTYTINSAVQNASKALQCLNEIEKNELKSQKAALVDESEGKSKSNTTKRSVLTNSWQKNQGFHQRMTSVKSYKKDDSTSCVHSKIKLFEHSSASIKVHHDNGQNSTVTEPEKELSVAKLDEYLNNLVEWERFALHLPNFKLSYIDIIKLNCPNSVQMRKYEAFKKWLSVHPNGSWKDVIFALTKIEEYRIVSELAGKVQKHSLPSFETKSHVEPYDLKQSVLKQLTCLQSEFAKLSVEIQNGMNSSLTVDPSILRSVVVYVNQYEMVKKVDPSNISSMYDLFYKLRCHYSFLDFEFIEIIFKYFLNMIKNRRESFPEFEILETRIVQYSDGLGVFKNTTEIKHLQDYLITTSPEESESCDEIKIRLEPVWGKQPIVLVERLVQTLFPYKVRLVKIMPGSVWAVFLIQKDFSQSIIHYSKQKLDFACSAGVIDIEIGTCSIVKKKKDKTYTFESGLLETCEKGNNEAAQFLVDLGVDTNHKNNEGKTPLMIASGSGHKEVVQTLLETEMVNVNQQDNEGQTALMFSTASNHTDISKELLDAETNPNLKDNEGNTALHIACSNEFTNEASLLMSYNANLFIKNNEKHTAIDVLVNKSKSVTAEDLVSNIPPSEVTTSFIMSCRQGKPCVITAMINKLSEHYLSEQEIIEYYLGCTRGDSEFVKGSKLDPSAIELSGITPLMIASSCGHIKIVDHLIEVKAKVNQCDSEGYSPLAYSITGSQSLGVVQSLLNAGAIPYLDVEEVKMAFDGRLNDVYLVFLQHSALHLYNVEIQEVIKMKEEIVSLVNKNQLCLGIFIKYLSQELGTKCLCESDDVSTVFNKLSLHHDFLNWNLLEILSQKYNFTKLNDYFVFFNKLLEPVKLKDFKQMVSLLPQETTTSVCNHDSLIIELSKEWWEKPLKIVNKLCSILFSSEYLCHLSISEDEKACYLEYKVPEGFDMASRLKKELCNPLGIIKVKVKNTELFSASAGDSTCYVFGKGLWLASFIGITDVIEILMDVKIDVNYFHHDKKTQFFGIKLDTVCSTPLIIACMKGHYLVVKQLLENKADPTLSDDNGCTPLMLASGKGHVKIAKLLIEKGANINDKSLKTGKTALIKASCGGHDELVSLLLNMSANPNISDVNKKTALHYSCMGGHYRVTNILVNSNISLNACDDEGVTPLMLASQRGHYEIVNLLLQNQASVNIRNRKLQTALEFACINGHKNVVELLLNEKASPSLSNVDGWVPIILASQEGHIKVVELFINYGVKPNVYNFLNKKTSLMQASERGHHNVVELLLAKGASPKGCDCYQKTALHYSSSNGHYHVVELLCNHPHTDLNICSVHGFTPLFLACNNGHFRIVKILLDKGAGIDVQNRNGLTAIHIACFNGDINVVELLLNCNTSLNIPDDDGLTPLMIACQNGWFQLVKILIEKGADVNRVSADGSTAIGITCFAGYKHILQLLLEHKANPNYPNHSGWSPFILACHEGHLNLVDMLCDAGIYHDDINKLTGTTALIESSKQGHCDVVEFLLEKSSNPNTVDHEGKTALHHCCANGHYKVVNLLLNHNANIHLCDNNGKTPLLLAYLEEHFKIVKNIINNHTVIDSTCEVILQLACINGQIDLVELLIDKNVDINVSDVYGDTPLILAYKSKKFNILKLLIERGADSDVSNESGNTVMHLACFDGNTYIVKLLLETNTNFNVYQSSGLTPLTLACQQGHLGIVELLITKGTHFDVEIKTALMEARENEHYPVVKHLLCNNADPNIVSNDGKTALHYSCSNGHYNIVALLLDHNADPNPNGTGETPLIIAFRKRDYKIMKLLLEKGADVNGLINNSRTILMSASSKGYQDIVELCINHNCDLNITDRFGWTALTLACVFDHVNIVELLLNAGANPNVKFGNEGQTALILVIKKGYFEIAKLLLLKGADPNIIDINQNTALHYSIVNGYQNITVLLLENNANPNVSDCEHVTLLMLASKIGCYDIVKLLLDREADTNLSDDDGCTCIMYASHYGYKDIVKLYIDHNVDLSATNKMDQTTLTLACITGHVDVVELLLNAGLNPNVSDQNQTTPLMLASKKGRYETVKLLLDRGANANISNGDGWTCNMYASYFGHEDIVKLYIDHNVDLSATNNLNQTALALACINDHWYIVELLLNAGANPNVKFGNKSQTGLILVSEKGYFEIFEIAKVFLLKGADPNIIDNNQNTALHYSCSNGHYNIVALLLDHNADPNPNGTSETPLIIAFRKRDYKIMKLLLEKGANVNGLIDNCQTIVMSASSKGYQDIVELCLNHNCDLNITDRFGWTALTLACVFDHVNIVELLLNAGANPNVKFGNEGQTALILVIKKGYFEIAKLLLLKGADPNIIDINQNTALHYSIVNGHQNITVLLLENNANPNVSDCEHVTLLMLASKIGCYDIVKLLLDREADTNLSDDDGCTCIMYASHYGYKDIVKLYIDHNVDLSATNNLNQTALALACIKGHVDVVELLLNAGVNPNVSDQNQKTPLMFTSAEGHYDIVKLLLDKGADTNISDDDGWTCIMYASHFGHKNIVKLYIDYNVDVSATNKLGQTALVLACVSRHVDVVELLLNAGVNPNLQNTYTGQSALLLYYFFLYIFFFMFIFYYY